MCCSAGFCQSDLKTVGETKYNTQMPAVTAMTTSTPAKANMILKNVFI